MRANRAEMAVTANEAAKTDDKGEATSARAEDFRELALGTGDELTIGSVLLAGVWVTRTCDVGSVAEASMGWVPIDPEPIMINCRTVSFFSLPHDIWL